MSEPTTQGVEKVSRAVRRLRWRMRRRWDHFRAPWPIVGECHSKHRPEHSCRQCDGGHAHSWRAWPAAPGWVTAGGGVPVRCRRCGGRKCDHNGCDQQRHTHTHWKEGER